MTRASMTGGSIVGGSMMNRREFLGHLKVGAVASSLVAAGRLPLLAAEPSNGSGIDGATGPHAVKPIRPFMPRFSPAAGPVAGRESYTLVYDIVHWQARQLRAGDVRNAVVGKVEIKRARDGRNVRWTVRQETAVGGVKNVIEAEIACNADELDSLREWDMRAWYTLPDGGRDPASGLRESGTSRGGRIVVECGGSTYGFTARNPVVTQWTLLDHVVRRARPEVEATFDLLQDLSMLKPRQSLCHDGTVRVKLEGDREVAFQAYVQTGEGVLPAHYLVDDEGRPQLVTVSMLSWALRSIG